jgi:phosphate transport system permease protein
MWMHRLVQLCGWVVVACVLWIIGFLGYAGLPAIREIGLRNFLFGTVWKPTGASPTYGILPFLLTSFYGTLGAIVLGVPIGILCAAQLAAMPHNRRHQILRSMVELMAGIPSVVYGLVGMIAIVPAVRILFGLSDGACLFSAILVLAIMILPTVISISETAMRAVPSAYTEASLALGATKTETTFHILLPAARSGILTAVVLGIGRAIGEAMAVMMVSGNVANLPKLFRSVRFLTTAVASEMSYATGLQRQALFSVAWVLFLCTMLLNLLLHLMGRRKK